MDEKQATESDDEPTDEGKVGLRKYQAYIAFLHTATSIHLHEKCCKFTDKINSKVTQSWSKQYQLHPKAFSIFKRWQQMISGVWNDSTRNRFESVQTGLRPELPNERSNIS